MGERDRYGLGRRLGGWAPRALMLVGLGCGGPPGDGGEVPASCEPLCALLADDCGLPSLGDQGRCVDTCAAEAREGADPDAYLSCVEASACDPFALVDCERRHGLP